MRKYIHTENNHIAVFVQGNVARKRINAKKPLKSEKNN